MSYLGVGVSPGTVPVYHSTNLKLLDKRIKIADLVLRFMILGLGVVAAVLIGTDSQVKVFFSFEKEAKFTDVKALVFLVVANGLAAGYSLIQGLRCVVSLVRGSVLFNKPLAWAIFSAEQYPFIFERSHPTFFLLSYTLWSKHNIIKILASTSCFFLKHFVAMLININYFFINSCKGIIKK
ncbi:CASP-like protein 2B1 isoform X1 [Arachis ipaensis]|uniref:CASP-like protein 2B1 isoform X1 n=1 Tax=Arachis ipaensis TaxID=130454 RepID=UPI0007AF75C7|nr:CASP-like protein 2B1 isoform X1 [Arachis ipaensis]XP_025649660.1 CASP-like protein 2B1 [Arachis hypogaea]